MTIKREEFGHNPAGLPVDLYTLTSGSGVEAQVMTYGGTLVSLRTPNREGLCADVVLGFDELAPYFGDHPYFGGIIGRYANRIACGRFSLNGKTYRLSQNSGVDHLHGGSRGFDRVMWQAQPRSTTEGPQLELRYVSRAGEEGYPGNLHVTVLYTLAAKTDLRIDYSATADEDTIVNLTNHAYFNLAADGTILRHLVNLRADTFLPIDERLIPYGKERAVYRTAFDFTRPRAIGSRIAAHDPQLRLAGGYDHTWVLAKKNGECSLAAEVFEPTSGRVLSVFTTQPGVQFYTGNLLDGRITGKQGSRYQKHSGFCLETQHFPDSPNQPAFPSTMLKAGEAYHETTIYRFATRS